MHWRKRPEGFPGQLLHTTDLPVKKIAASLGYDDPFHFSRVFRTVNETSPTQYRLMHKG